MSENDKDTPIYFIRHAAEYAECHIGTIENYVRRGFVGPTRDHNNFRRFSIAQLKEMRRIYRSNKPRLTCIKNRK